MKWDVERGRATRPKLKVGICGDPATVKFCHRIEQNYLNGSPFRVSITRLAAVQAVLEEAEKE